MTADGPDMQKFTPSADSLRALRDALGRYATGVTVVTARGPEGPVGITANSFSSLSLDPPLVLWCPAKRSARYAAFAAARHYAIHVLGAEQLELCRRFARSADDFDGVALGETAEGTPLIAGCLAHFECAAWGAHDGGDHAILIGRVLRAAMRPGEPLLFFGGRYGDFMHHG